METLTLPGSLIASPPRPGRRLAAVDTEDAVNHVPVMLDEVVEAFAQQPPGMIIDATVGLGGHAKALLDANPDLTLVGFDRDADALAIAAETLEPHASRFELVHADFRELPTWIAESPRPALRGVFVDLGVSSLQLDDPDRGFSFRHDGPLDMRMDRRQGRTAAAVVNGLDERELARLLRDWGEERFSARIARAIVAARDDHPLRTTADLARIVEFAIPRRGHDRIHPATRTFQALRIAVNDELAGLFDFTVAAARALDEGGRLAVIAFHSLEDRPVKYAFRFLESECECPPVIPQCTCAKRREVRILTRRPRRPRAEETEANPRARSAKLRVLERIRG